MYLLDTNILTELRANKPQPSIAVRAWASKQPAHLLYLSAVTVMELEIGVMRMERRDRRQGAQLRTWSEAVIAQFAERVLPFSFTTARLCARLHVPDPRSSSDAMIAATALEHRLTVVTRNVNDFAGTGVEILNPWNEIS